MLPSKNIDKIILEYNNILIRDLGFGDWRIWEPMISKVMNTLGVDSLEGMSLMEAKKCPGREIVMALIRRWLSGKGKYWGNLVRIEEYTDITPYFDYIEYTIKVKNKGELLEELSGHEVYQDYEILRGIFESRDYHILMELDGTKISIKQ